MAATIQSWVVVGGGLATAILGIVTFRYRVRYDRLTLIGESFAATVDSLTSTNDIKRLAAAIQLRRFFDRTTEQGTGGKGHATPYHEEAVRVIAALLRGTNETSEFQKLLADGLAYARELQNADLQRCNLAGAYLGERRGVRVDISGADLFQADLTGASLRGAIAKGAVFFGATLTKTVLEGADLSAADFRDADLAQARFANATLDGARFEGATNIPDDLAARLGALGAV